MSRSSEHAKEYFGFRATQRAIRDAARAAQGDIDAQESLNYRDRDLKYQMEVYFNETHDEYPEGHVSPLPSRPFSRLRMIDAGKIFVTRDIFNKVTIDPQTGVTVSVLRGLFGLGGRTNVTIKPEDGQSPSVSVTKQRLFSRREIDVDPRSREGIIRTSRAARKMVRRPVAVAKY